jgi:hypothetical protein
MANKEWVALETFSAWGEGELLYEEGGVYSHEPMGNTGRRSSRELTPGEHEAICPRCNQRFASTVEGTAKTHRDLHFDGDEDIPSICRNFPPRRHLRAVGVEE